MTKAQVTIRRTPTPNVLELEVAQPQQRQREIPLEQLLARHQARSLTRHFVQSRERVMLLAKVMRCDGAPIDTNQIGNLLDELRAAIEHSPIRSARAA